jgi:N-acetylglucosaminyldiphosphoundecaprenol N-acetyl-beta-D-mannosaminyltransferase
MGLVFWSRLTGGKLKERVTGTDLVSGLVAMAEEFDYRLFLLGGDSAGRAAEKFKVQSPKLKVAYAVGPLLNADGNPVDNEQAEVEKEALSKINKFKPEILLVAFGAPKQEKWIAKNMSKADFKVAIGVGGALSYISGEKKRAPKWVQNLGLEWLHRLVREPSRIKRQTALPIFVFRSLKELVFKK